MGFSEEDLTLNLRVPNKSCSFAVLIFTKIYSPLGNLASRDGTAQRIGLLTLSEDVSHDYLANGTYPEEATKAVTGVIRKRAKKFQHVDGVLHYKETLKTGRLRLRQVTYCS